MNIVISGGSHGLGADLADYLSINNKIISFARGDRQINNPNLTHLSNIDVINPANLDQISGHLIEADALINNVGTAYDGILATQGTSNIKELLDVNLYSVIYLTKMYIRHRMQKRLSGSVIFISSIISIRGYSGLAVYSATKGALNSFCSSLAREMGPKGFRFNSVLPGYFESDLSKNLSSEKKAQIIRRTPLGRLAKTSDICPLVKFLLSDEAQFITGQNFVVDGGLTC